MLKSDSKTTKKATMPKIVVQASADSKRALVDLAAVNGQFGRLEPGTA
jgi:hypothetical protein